MMVELQAQVQDQDCIDMPHLNERKHVIFVELKILIDDRILYPVS
jgi:hypothetical protein